MPDDPAIDDAGVARSEEHQTDERNRAGQPGFGIAGIGLKERGKTAPDEGKRENDDEDRFIWHRHS
jgi:hypothetical protein